MIFLRIFVAVFLIGLMPRVWALGPIDGEITVSLWNNQFESDLVSGDVDAGSLALNGEIWIGDKWGLKAARYESDLEGTAISNQSRTQIELRRRFFSLSDNNFLALGAGIEDIELFNGESSNGLRLSIEGRVAVTPVTYLFARGALLPDMSDAGGFSNLTGSEVELGASFTPFPFISVKVGFLRLNLDFDNADGGAGSSTESDGFLIGAGIHW